MTMLDALALELALVRLDAARTALAAGRARLAALLDTSDEALQAACALIPLKRAIMGAQVEVELARGPVGA